MKVVIQCAAGKRPDAGALHHPAPDGRQVVFVAQPELAPAADAVVYARPDDVAFDGRTWRQHVVELNEKRPANAQSLLPAYQLYANQTYRELADHFGVSRLFILSAGWGLIPADFRTPLYDITFSAQADSWKRRRPRDQFVDFQMLPDDGEPLVFLGGKDYLPLYCTLTAGLAGLKTVFFRQAQEPRLPTGFRVVRYHTPTRTNWHYECARDLIDGRVDVVLSPLAADKSPKPAR
jgi:hypothetical protein